MNQESLFDATTGREAAPPPPPWEMPEDFPDLSAAPALSIDIETRDDDLKAKGPGVRRGAYIVGVSVATSDGKFAAYYPIAHDEGSNLNKEAVFNWLRHELSRSSQPKIGANILYDLDFLAEVGVVAAGDRWIDVQIAEPLIDENARSYSLASLAAKYTDERKLTDPLVAECVARGWKGDPRAHIWRLPASVVGAYAVADATLPVAIHREQKKILLAEGTYDLFRIETFLLPLLLQMRRTGVRIDVPRLEGAIADARGRLAAAKKRLAETAGASVEVWAADSIARAFDAAGDEYPLTPKTQRPSFTRKFLERCRSPVARDVVEVRRLDRFLGTFLEGHLKGNLIDDRIHCMFHPLRGDETGTVIGRFSSSKPNLQQIPSRDPELGPLCRSIFVPEEGQDWGKADFSQVEFRMFAHVAKGDGADNLRLRYTENPDTDYHAWVAERAFGDPKKDRTRAKNINFGLLYGMGVRRLADYIKADVDEVRAFLDLYHRSFPCARETARRAQARAASVGYVRTILGRRRRFNLWEPADRRISARIDASTDRAAVDDAVRKMVRELGGDLRAGVKRAGTHKALHFVVAGSAADLGKKGMVDCWRSGIFDILAPHLTVHDELDVSVPRTAEGVEAFREMARLMEDAVPLRVPVKVDLETGPNWGNVAKLKEKKDG